ncbi:hypothetical protein [Timonella sp. A28]|uniref:hypothetical protein n=1 Tax=Timonella sp. A28 TaxID=3442640 RepID=UPI003EC09DE5
MTTIRYYVCQICRETSTNPDGWKQVSIGALGFIVCPIHESISFADLKPTGPIAIKGKK